MRAGEDGSDEEKWERGKEEDVSDAQHSGALISRGEVSGYGLQERDSPFIDQFPRRAVRFAERHILQTLRFSFGGLANYVEY